MLPEKRNATLFRVKIIHEYIKIAIYSVFASYFPQSCNTNTQCGIIFHYWFCSFNHLSGMKNFINAICLVLPTFISSGYNWSVHEVILLQWMSGYSINGTWGESHTWGPFYSHGLTLIPEWTSNHMPSKVWDEITYQFLNLNCGCNHLSMLWLKLSHVRKGGPRDH